MGSGSRSLKRAQRVHSFGIHSKANSPFVEANTFLQVAKVSPMLVGCNFQGIA